MKTQQKLKKYLKVIKEKNAEINAFLEIRPEKELLQEAKEVDKKIKEGNAGELAGKIIAIKANINCIGLNASCASKTLENYKSTFNATVIEKIKSQDGIIIGTCNMDEFACGSSGETSAFNPTNNPAVQGLIPGGSSSGSAAAVSAGMCDMALGSDTGGSIRNPASHCGVIGIKPTYSSVSRCGLLDLAMSFDQIGTLARNVQEASLLLNSISGKDEKDSISQETKEINLEKIEKPIKNITIGILDLSNLNVDKKIQTEIENKINELVKKHNLKIKKIKIPHLELGLSTYYPVTYVEFFSATRRFDGRRYGTKIEDSCGIEVLRRILGGQEISKAEFADRYYHKALKVQDFFAEQFAKAFKEVDCIVSPTVPKLPHKIGTKISPEAMYAYDTLTAPANLAGCCAINVPICKIQHTEYKNIEVPLGIQIMCDKFQEEKMLQIAKAFEDIKQS